MSCLFGSICAVRGQGQAEGLASSGPNPRPRWLTRHSKGSVTLGSHNLKTSQKCLLDVMQGLAKMMGWGMDERALQMGRRRLELTMRPATLGHMLRLAVNDTICTIGSYSFRSLTGCRHAVADECIAHRLTASRLSSPCPWKRTDWRLSASGSPSKGPLGLPRLTPRPPRDSAEAGASSSLRLGPADLSCISIWRSMGILRSSRSSSVSCRLGEPWRGDCCCAVPDADLQPHRLLADLLHQLHAALLHRSWCQDFSLQRILLVR